MDRDVLGARLHDLAREVKAANGLNTNHEAYFILLVEVGFQYLGEITGYETWDQRHIDMMLDGLREIAQEELKVRPKERELLFPYVTPARVAEVMGHVGPDVTSRYTSDS